MTPAERAHLIDKQEFEAECRAARERAYALLNAGRGNIEAQPKASAEDHRPASRFKSQRPARRTERSNGGGRPATLLTFNGESLSIAEWADRLGIARRTIRSRIEYGWPIERVLSESVQLVGKRMHKRRLAKQNREESQ